MCESQDMISFNNVLWPFLGGSASDVLQITPGTGVFADKIYLLGFGSDWVFRALIFTYCIWAIWKTREFTAALFSCTSAEPGSLQSVRPAESLTGSEVFTCHSLEFVTWGPFRSLLSWQEKVQSALAGPAHCSAEKCLHLQLLVSVDWFMACHFIGVWILFTV